MNNWRVPDRIGWYLAGFVDGEGSFNVSLRKKTDYIQQWQISPSFNVSQRDPTILALLKRHFGCGKIKKRKDGLYMYEVTNYQMIQERIIPFFRKFQFLSASKKYNFSIFCKISQLMNRKVHLTENGLKEILRLREKLNIGRGRKRKYIIQDVFQGESSETIRQSRQ